MDTEKLKQKILDLAIRGKLVPQDPNDETAQDLIKKIQEEKIKLIKEGKIKSTKNESYIFKDSNNSYYEKVGTTIKNIDDEIPFEIPNNWCWVRLNQIGSIIGGGTPSTSVKEYWNNGNIVWVTPAYMSKNKHTYISDSDRKITQLGLNNSSTKLMPPYSIIMSSRAPIGYLAINLVPACTSQGCKSIVPFIKDMSVYLYYAIKSSITRIIEASSGTTFDEISGKDFGNLLIPISSINEQLKICNLLSKVFDQVEEISQNYKNIKKYISVAKIKILENIFGENSSYKSYYEICVGKLEKYSNSITKGTTPTSYGFKYLNSGIPFIKVENVSNYMIMPETIKCFISEEANNFQKRSQLKEGDILFSIAGTIGKLCLVNSNNIPANTNQAFAIISGYQKNINPYYLLYYLEWSKTSDSKVESHGLGMNNATLAGLRNLEIWFPKKISDQEIIVNNINKIFNILDSMIS